MLKDILKELEYADTFYGDDHGESMLNDQQWAELRHEAEQQIIRMQVNGTANSGLLHPTIAAALAPHTRGML
jgi:hypothetical protein